MIDALHTDKTLQENNPNGYQVVSDNAIAVQMEMDLMLREKLLAVINEKTEKERAFYLPLDLKSQTVNPHWFNQYLDAFINARIDSYNILALLLRTYDSLKVMINSEHHGEELKRSYENIRLLWNAVVAYYGHVLTEDDLRLMLITEGPSVERGVIQDMLNCYLDEYENPQIHLILKVKSIKSHSRQSSSTDIHSPKPHQITRLLEVAESITISHSRPSPSSWEPKIYSGYATFVLTLSADSNTFDVHPLKALIENREFGKLTPLISSIQKINWNRHLSISSHLVKLFDEHRWHQIYLYPGSSSKEPGRRKKNGYDVEPRDIALPDLFKHDTPQVIKEMLAQMWPDRYSWKYRRLTEDETLPLAIACLQADTASTGEHLGCLLYPKSECREDGGTWGVKFNHGKNLLLVINSELNGLMVLFEKKADDRVEMMLLDVGEHTPLWLSKLLPFQTDIFCHLASRCAKTGLDNHEDPALYHVIKNIKQLMTWAIQGALSPETSLFELLDSIKRDNCFPLKLVWEDGRLVPGQIAPPTLTVPASSSVAASSSSASTECSSAAPHAHFIFPSQKIEQKRAESESNALRQAKILTIPIPTPDQDNILKMTP